MLWINLHVLLFGLTDNLILLHVHLFQLLNDVRDLLHVTLVVLVLVEQFVHFFNNLSLVLSQILFRKVLVVNCLIVVLLPSLMLLVHLVVVLELSLLLVNSLLVHLRVFRVMLDFQRELWLNLVFLFVHFGMFLVFYAWFLRFLLVGFGGVVVCRLKELLVLQLSLLLVLLCL